MWLVYESGGRRGVACTVLWRVLVVGREVLVVLVVLALVARR